MQPEMLDFEEYTIVSTDRLMEEITRVLAELKTDEHNVIYTTCELVDTPRGVVRHEGTGAMTVRIAGEVYLLHTGVNRCVLQHFKQDAHGKGYRAETIDVRDRRFIETDSQGRVEIRTRRASGPAERWLNKLAKGIADWSGNVRIDVE
jgi:hypothetical protein